MQIESQTFLMPQYQSAILRKQRQSKHLSPKVTHIYPEIKQVEKFKIKRHHLDDTEVKQALQYDYEQNQQPRQYLFKGNRLQYDKKTNIQSNRKISERPVNQPVNQMNNNKLSINSQYFERNQPQNKNLQKPQRDLAKDAVYKNNNLPNNPKSPEYQTRLKKSISTSDFQSLKKEQKQMENKVLNKLNHLQNQTQRINQYLIQKKQKSACLQSGIQKYKSEDKAPSVHQQFNKLKQKLQRQRTKQKQRLDKEIKRIKQESKKIKDEQKKRKKSFQQLIQKKNQKTDNFSITKRAPVTSMQTVSENYQMNSKNFQSNQNFNMIKEKLNEIEKKYLPKTNIVNKRIQCEIYDPRMDSYKRLQQKPPFRCDSQSDTDSQFSDF